MPAEPSFSIVELQGKLRTLGTLVFLLAKLTAKVLPSCCTIGGGMEERRNCRPFPPSDGWREGADQVRIASQLVALGCPNRCISVGFSLGGQLALWGLQAAAEQNCSFVRGAAVLSPSLESARSLAHLKRSFVGKTIERVLVKELQSEVRKRQRLFPHTASPEVLERIRSIESFDREMVIDYYGFASVCRLLDQKTSGLYLLETLKLPYAIVYSRSDPMYEADIVPELKRRVDRNPNGHLILTDCGGHVAYIATETPAEDCFWGMNRMLEFCENLLA